jgi:hypothetical protein
LATLAAILVQNPICLVQKYVHPTAGHKKPAMDRYDLILKQAEEKSQQKLSGKPN